jgi:hypothetical protein
MTFCCLVTLTFCRTRRIRQKQSQNPSVDAKATAHQMCGYKKYDQGKNDDPREIHPSGCWRFPYSVMPNGL